ncbi:hypothetical protein SAMN02745181_1296 [Rubritalea squalenifaciens DSM 18772]|uniref:Uncharacterized protein n=1 Tax=Rubritalea squalenifaciens DSM 18772 TaxID=1123071 RepID=A0A1M6GX91_9BACT|nr:hypothetical protein [Rubritalea squalenifaciens]SHJ14527.1 hypothetical protein SAMN02745181_1296 [Rubritalea squalenifaciens DSM 18772]
MKKRHLIAFPAAALIAGSTLNAQSVNPDLNQAASKVDLSGSYVELNRVDGDIQLLTEYLQLIVEVARKNGEDIPENFDIAKLMTATGLDSLKATAMSNTKQGDIWLNQAYLQTDGSGIFSIVGETNKQYTAPTMCPAGTDLALQLTLDLRKAPEIARKVAESVGKKDTLESQITMELPDLGLSIEDSLKKSHTVLNLAIDLDPTKTIALGENKMPRPNLVARADGLVWLWDKFGDELIQSQGMPLKKTEKDGVITYAVPEDMAPALQGYAPLLVVDKNKDQIWVASSADFLAKSQTSGQQLADDPAFKAAWAGMPATGNSMAYISKELVNQLETLYKTAEKEGLLNDEDFQKAKPLIDRLIQDLTKPKTGYVFAFGNDGSGIHLANKTAFPSKYGRYLQSAMPIIEKFQKEKCEKDKDSHEE